MLHKSGLLQRQKSITELIFIAVILFTLMACFIHYFMKQSHRITLAAFEGLANNFIAQVTVVHGQWFMDKQPTVVKVASMTSNKVLVVPVNSRGWLDASDSYLACEKIWRYAMQESLTLMKTPISVIEVKKKPQPLGRICRYSISTGEYFEYNSFTGKVAIHTIITK